MPRFIYMYMPERGKSEGLEERSGRPDLNWGPRGPKPRALTRLRHAPALDCRQIVGSPRPAVKTLESRIPRFSSCYLAWLQLPTPPRNPRLHVESAENIVSFRYRCYYSLQASYRLQGMISPWGWPVERACTTT